MSKNVERLSTGSRQLTMLHSRPTSSVDDRRELDNGYYSRTNSSSGLATVSRLCSARVSRERARQYLHRLLSTTSEEGLRMTTVSGSHTFIATSGESRIKASQIYSQVY